MSSATYETLLHKAICELSEIRADDSVHLGRKIGKNEQQDYMFFSRVYICLYLRYMCVSQTLCTIYDQILHPQKRMDVRALLDSSLGRMLEIKNKITDNCGGYFNPEDALIELKIIPDCISVPIPSYFVNDYSEELMERRRLITFLISQFLTTDPDSPVALAANLASITTKNPSNESITLAEAVNVLQCNERGRQGRLKTLFHDIRYDHSVDSPVSSERSVLTGFDQASTLVQRSVLRFLALKESEETKMQESLFLGIDPDPELDYFTEEKRLERIMFKRKMKQKENLLQLIRETKKFREKIKADEGPKTMEGMLEDVLRLLSYLRLTTTEDIIPTIPPEEDGGSLALLQYALEHTGKHESAKMKVKIENNADNKERDNMMSKSSQVRGEQLSATSRSEKGTNTNEAPLLRNEENDADKQGKINSQNLDETKPLSGEAKTVKKKRAPRRLTKEEEAENTLPTLEKSLFWGVFKEEANRYESIWQSEFIESYEVQKDFNQGYQKELLRQEILKGPNGLLLELRRCVDQLVMVEIQNLRERLTKKKNKKRKKKPKAKKGKRKPMDPAAGVPIETYLNSAVYLNILQNTNENYRVSSFLGEFSFQSKLQPHIGVASKKTNESFSEINEFRLLWSKVLNDWNPYTENSLRMTKSQFEVILKNLTSPEIVISEPSLEQVRRSVIEYGVLSLGSQVIHDLIPSPKGILLYGFKGTGKTMLTHIICNESGATFFDISPKVLTGAVNLGKIIQMIFRLARCLAPSIIYFDEAEMVCSGKRKKKKKNALAKRSKRIYKEVVKGMKKLEPVDRVLIVGNSSSPWEADPRAFSTVFEKQIFCAHPDYGTRLLLWKKLIQSRVSVELPINHYSILAHLSKNLSAGTIASIISETLTDRRVELLSQIPLVIDDFFPMFSKVSPIMNMDFRMMKEYFQHLPLSQRFLIDDDFNVRQENRDTKRKTKTKGK